MSSVAVSSSFVVSPKSTGKRLREEAGREEIVVFDSDPPPFVLALAGGDGEGVAVSEPFAVPLDVEAIFQGIYAPFTSIFALRILYCLQFC
jgi:hypothetical protein